MSAITKIEWSDRTWAAAKTAAKRLRLSVQLDAEIALAVEWGQLSL